MSKQQKQAGFTLVELAIVMIIIGLLIAGVLKGQELIGNARVTSTVAQIKGIDAGVSTFKDTYNALPGDMTNGATRLPNCANACSGAGGTGNGTLANAPGVTPIGSDSEGFFPQLAAANLVTGLQTAATGNTAINRNYPAAKIDTAVIYSSWKTGAIAAAIGSNGTNDGLFLTFNGVVGPANNAAMKPSEALRIDTKLDDGDPSGGDTVVGGANCATAGAAGAPGTYTTTTNTDVCTLFARIQG